MSVEENKALVRRFIEAGNNVKGDTSKIQAFVNDFLASDHIHHTPNGDTNLAHTIQFYTMVFNAFPDLKYTIHDIIAEGDKVVIRVSNSATHKGVFQGIPPTGKQISFTGIDIFRVDKRRICEEWSSPDVLGLISSLELSLHAEPFFV